VIGRYAFAVYDEGGLLDMSVAGYPNWPDGPCSTTPTPTPWLVNVGRKATVGFADLTALPTSNAIPAPTFPPEQVANIVGWQNYATTQRAGTGFANFSFPANCARQDHYGSYLLDFGDPPFSIENLSDKLLASNYPFTSVASAVLSGRTDQAFMTRQQLLRLQRSLGFSQNVLQSMGTFSRERNRPAPDWPNLQPTGSMSEGRFNLNNLDLVKPNPGECVIAHGRKRGWVTGKSRGHRCGTPDDVIELFGLFWVVADLNTNPPQPGYWRYVDHVGRDHDPNPNVKHSIPCFRVPTNKTISSRFSVMPCSDFSVREGVTGIQTVLRRHLQSVRHLSINTTAVPTISTPI
jgi:hypothetical protein